MIKHSFASTRCLCKRHWAAVHRILRLFFAKADGGHVAFLPCSVGANAPTWLGHVVAGDLAQIVGEHAEADSAFDAVSRDSDSGAGRGGV